MVARRLRAVILAIFVLLAGLAAALSQCGHWLAAPAHPAVDADVIVVLGGDSGDRALKAVELYRAGRARHLIITGSERSPRRARQAQLTWGAALLEEEGIPRDALTLDVASFSSWTEATNTAETMKRRGWNRALVVSDPPHMRRLQWTWSKALAGTSLRFDLVATTPEWWMPERWWVDEKSAQAVITEHIKLVYYVATK